MIFKNTNEVRSRLFSLSHQLVTSGFSENWYPKSGPQIRKLKGNFFDKVLKIDDPVGAVSVHGLNGSLGTILVGFLSTDNGLFYGGGAAQLGSQLIGVGAVAAWAMGLGFLVFFILKKTIGVRVSMRIEEEGLDIYEHGESTYN